MERDGGRRLAGARAWLVIAVVGGLVIGLGVWRYSTDGPAPVDRAEVQRAVQAAIAQAEKDQANTPPDAATAYRAIVPSLVTITTEGSAGDTAGDRAVDTAGLGTGVVINSKASVLTALHVVQGARQIRVRFADGTQSPATVATRQPASDTAVLAVVQPPGVIVPAVLGGGAQVGDAVFPVGNPLGLTGSLSAGVVSGLGRTVATAAGRLDGLIQFDAAVNPGNSGGPLLNRSGQVIGIVTGLANPSGQSYFVGIGFAVPIATAVGAAGGPQQ